MMQTSIEQAVHRINSSSLATANTLDGCTDQGIGRLETELGKVLPQAYKDFLALYGKRAGTSRLAPAARSLSRHLFRPWKLYFLGTAPV